MMSMRPVSAVSRLLMATFSILIISELVFAGATIVNKDGSGNVRPDSFAALASLHERVVTQGNVRVCVEVNAPNENYLPDTPAYRRQAQQIDSVRRRVISALRRAAPATSQYQATNVGPNFWVVVDSAGLDFLTSSHDVTQFFTPAPHSY